MNNASGTNIKAKIKILILKVPVFAEEETRIPFIGPALIASALKDEGYAVRQFDLNAISRRRKYYYDWVKPPADTLWSFERVIYYLKESVASDIEAAILRMLGGIDFSKTDFALFCPARLIEMG